jgi:uncharacterized membrane protein YfcA
VVPFDIDPGLFALLIAAAIFAGWVDAVVGGGGLIQLPVLLVAFPTAPTALMLGTNKMASVFGTATSAIAYARKIKLEHRLLWPTVGLALLGSGAGALAALSVSSDALKPIIIAVLLAVLVLVVAKPQLGLEARPELHTRWRGAAVMVVCGLVIAFYDGIIGPGTGIFLAVAFTSILGMDFLAAAAHTKVVNVTTNLGALVVFAAQDNIWWLLGAVMGLGTMLGAWFGAHTAMSKGSKFVRVVLVIVVLALLARLSWDVYSGR